MSLPAIAVGDDALSIAEMTLEDAVEERDACDRLLSPPWILADEETEEDGEHGRVRIRPRDGYEAYVVAVLSATIKACEDFEAVRELKRAVREMREAWSVDDLPTMPQVVRRLRQDRLVAADPRLDPVGGRDDADEVVPVRGRPVSYSVPTSTGAGTKVARVVAVACVVLLLLLVPFMCV